MSEKVTTMFSPGDKCNDNRPDNNNAISQNDVNCNTAKRSFAPQAAVVACASKRKRQLNLRKCKSESDVGRRYSIDFRMGSTISRSKSYDNIETDSIVYESLTKNRKVDEKSLCSLDDSDEDYKLLESSENDDDSDSGGEDDSGCVTKTISKRDGHDNAENSNSVSAFDNHNSCMQQTPRAGNEVEIDSLCKKYSTLPRVKIKKGIVDRDQFLRCSVPYKSFDERAHCSKEEVISDFEVVSDGKSETAEVSETLEAPIKSDKLSDVTSSQSTSFRSMTLPKTRSRLSEPYFRHSLRQAIDLTMPRKHVEISNALEHNAAIIPGNNETMTMVAMAGNGKHNLNVILGELWEDVTWFVVKFHLW